MRRVVSQRYVALLMPPSTGTPSAYAKKLSMADVPGRVWFFCDAHPGWKGFGYAKEGGRPAVTLFGRSKVRMENDALIARRGTQCLGFCSRLREKLPRGPIPHSD